MRLRVLYRRQSSGRCCFGSQLVLCRADREHALLGARLLFVAPGAAERGVEAVDVERLLERLRLHDVGVNRRAVRERIDPHLHCPRG